MPLGYFGVMSGLANNSLLLSKSRERLDGSLAEKKLENVEDLCFGKRATGARLYRFEL